MNGQLVHAPTRKKQKCRFYNATISQKIGVVFGFLLLVAAINVVVVQGMLQQMNGMAAALNVAGRMRMLSQKLAFETSTVLQGQFSGRETAAATIGEFDTAVMAFVRGGNAFGYDIRMLPLRHHDQLDLLRLEWSGYKSRVEAILTAPPASAANANAGTPQLQQVSEGSARVLTSAERLTRSLTLEAQEAEKRALMGIYALFLLDVLAFMAVFVLVRKQIVHPLRELVLRSRELAEGNYHARLNYRSFDEIGQLSHTFNYSAERIGKLIGDIEQDRQNLRQAESMFRGLAENSVVGVYIVQGQKFRFVNAKMAEMFCLSPEEMTSSVGFFDTVAEGDRHMVESNIQKRLRGDIQEIHYERLAHRKDGSMFDVEVFGSTMEIDGKAATIGIMLDITERKKAEASMQQASMVYQYSSEGMTITDPDGVIIDVNPAFTRITGYTRDEVIGRNPKVLQSGRQNQAFYEDMWKALLSTGHWEGEIWNRRKNGEVYAEWLVINTSYKADGSAFRRMAIFSDITERKKFNDLIWQQANFDSLTGLPNRHMFRDRLEQEIRKSHRAGLPLALMFIDLDRFKEVNDTLGHAVGDNLLKEAAQRLTSCVRESDTVARLGGDEFTIILGELSAPNSVERIAQEILQKMAKPFELEEETAYLSASIGITFYPDDATELEDLLKNADQAMYAAKDGGRNRHNYFTPSMQETAQARRRIAGDLRCTITENQLRVYYQPIVDLMSGTVEKAEALVRWQHPKRGLISPAEFIPIAEETGMICDIGDWVFQEATRQAARWRLSHRPDFQISINTSPAQYRNNGIDYDAWLEHLSRIGLPQQGIAVEITEGLLLETSAAVTDQLLRFRDSGIHVSLDDFGTGYSSLSYLKRLDIDYLKIDRSFAQNLIPGSEDMALYEAIIAMAHKLGLKVIAEGVETEEQRALLTAAGCDYGQGYLFSRPVPADQFEALLCPGMMN
ncbi:MAG TPA: EAL domain-containing protein [Noviherbaspirillum sp.]|nr:EAL domain-containing protein [Noviherbaspirillum sp.]